MTLPDPSAEAPPPAREPFFKLPAVVVGTLVVLGLVHAAVSILSPDGYEWVIRAFAFIPFRLTGEAPEEFPGGTGGAIWTFVTYALLHANLGHILVNGFYLAAFGSPLALRFGAVRFLALSAAGAIGGALLHWFTHWGELQPIIGASAAVSAHLAATCRFAFAAGGPLSGSRGAGQRPAPPLLVALSDRRVLSFLATWFGINLLFGLVSQADSGPMQNPIAWEAHIGGFLVGLLLFPLFDPVGRDGADSGPPSGGAEPVAEDGSWGSGPGDGQGVEGQGSQIPRA